MSDHDPLSPERLADYDVPPAPRGFSSRVMAAVAMDEARPRASWQPRRWQVIAGVAAVAVALVAAGALLRSGGTAGSHGARITATRESIVLGGRGVAVAEAGTTLSWTIDARGDAVVEQSAGQAFYRVEHGGPFEVKTPLGAVDVTGTCFSVEVTAMKNPMNRDVMKGAAFGAILATAVVVTVYEGGVSFANPAGKLHLGPGETAVAQGSDAPRLRGTLTAALDPQAQQLADAHARISELERELAAARGSDGDDGDFPPKDPGRYYAPSADTLRDMADKCWIAFDRPPFDTEEAPVLVDSDLASQVGVSDADRAAINDAYRRVHDRDLDAVRRLYMDLTGADANATAALSLEALEAEIKTKSGPDAEIAARRDIARERAGLDPTPSSADLAHRSAIERLLRIRISLGADAEAAAASVVGSDRARNLRANNGVGWRNNVSDYGGCTEHY